MRDAIRVHVVDYGRQSLYMRYLDPLTGRQITKTTGTSRRKEAVKIAAKWEADLQEGRYKPPSKVTWEEFRERYETDVLTGLADGTASKVWSTFNSIEAHVSPQRLADLTADRIGTWQNALRDAGRAEATIKSHSAHLKAALNWAHDVGLLTVVPKVRMPQRAKGGKVMKGRPITGEEFDRLLLAAEKVVKDRAESWKHILRGLWWSGLRLGEALALTWDGDDIAVDLSGKRPMLRIAAESEKGHTDRILPLAPEAAEFLLQTPPDERTGFVFNPAMERQHPGRPTLWTVSRTIVAIGEKAGVKVNAETRGGVERIKWASAHDLRRAFGDRWSIRVMPAVLQQLMRHESIETTLRYYVGRDAQATADILWETVSGNSGGNTAPEAKSDERHKSHQEQEV